MCYSKKQYENRAKRYKALEAEKKVLEAELEKIKADLIRDIETAGAVQGVGETWVIHWTPYEHPSFDSKRFKADYGEELYQSYTKKTPSHKFNITAKK